MALSDLELAVLLLNSVDLLEDPPDRMAEDLTWWRRALRRNGEEALARRQREADLPMLHSLRATIRTVFESKDAGRARAVLNAALLEAGAVVQLRPDGLGVAGTGPGGDLPARLLVAVADPGRRARRRPAGHLRQRPVQVRVRRPVPRRHAPLLLHAVQRPGRGPRLPEPEGGDRIVTAARQPRPGLVRLVVVRSPRLLVLSAPLLAALLVSLTPVTAAADDQPVLGSPSHLAPAGQGWGRAHPRHVFNGGDPSGEVVEAPVAALGRRHRRRPGRDLAAAARGRLLRQARPDRAPRGSARHLRGRHHGVHPAGVPRGAPPRRPGR